MGAWGIKALESDEGLDVLDILKNEYVPEHPVMDLGEIIQLMKEQVMLGEEPSQIDFLFDNTAMALAELYFQRGACFPAAAAYRHQKPGAGRGRNSGERGALEE